MKIKFTKIQALGNDYIYIDTFQQDLSKVNLKKLSQQICHRHLGVGGDGLILIVPGKKYRFRMIFYNPDGSQAETCGNGLRCMAKYIYDHRLSNDKIQNIEVKGRMVQTQILHKDRNYQIKVDLGTPVLERKKIPMRGKSKFAINEKIKVDKKFYEITSLSVGNPHTIVFVKDFEWDWKKAGYQIEHHPLFPKKTNVEFVKIINRKKIEIRVWERGVGETLASGTGSCASLVAGVLSEGLNRKVLAMFPFGSLIAEWDQENNHLYTTGEAQEVFSGIYDFKN